MDSKCNYPITTDAMKVEIKPLMKELIIKEAWGKSQEILGTVNMYLEGNILGGRGCSNKRRRIQGHTDLARANEEVEYGPCIIP